MKGDTRIKILVCIHLGILILAGFIALLAILGGAYKLAGVFVAISALNILAFRQWGKKYKDGELIEEKK